MMKLKNIIYSILFILLIIIFFALVFLTVDSKTIKEVKEFIKSDINLVYVYNKEDKYIIDLLDKYSINYLKIDEKTLNKFERKKLETLFKKEKIVNNLAIFKNGDLEGLPIEITTAKDLIAKLQDKEIIPNIISSDVKKIEKESLSILDNKYSIIYMPYIYNNDIKDQNEIFKSISKKYDIDYEMIKTYLLSKTQQNNINKLLDISDVDNQILLVIKDNKMIANIRGVHSKNTYIETLYDVGFIDNLEDKLNELSYNEFKSLIKDNNKNIVLLIQDNSADSEKVYELLNQMVYNYDIDVNYINLGKTNSEVYQKVKNKLKDMGYEEVVSMPMVLIIESNKVVDYIVGNSTEKYFLDSFIENGVIKGDVIDE